MKETRAQKRAREAAAQPAADPRSQEALELLATVVAVRPGDPTLLDLAGTVERIIQSHAVGIVTGETQAADVATLIVSQPIIWSGIARLQRIVTRHQPRRWAADSGTEVCSSCRVAWPCEEAVILGLAPAEQLEHGLPPIPLGAALPDGRTLDDLRKESHREQPTDQ